MFKKLIRPALAFTIAIALGTFARGQDASLDPGVADVMSAPTDGSDVGVPFTPDPEPPVLLEVPAVDPSPVPEPTASFDAPAAAPTDSQPAVDAAGAPSSSPDLSGLGYLPEDGGSGDTAVAAQPATYTVQPGDTLASLARQLGVGVGDLLAANPGISDPNLIGVADTLNLPDGSASVPAAPAAPDASAPGVSNADAALAFGRTDPINANTGDTTWNFWCLGFVNQAEKAAGNYVPALQAPDAFAAFQQFQAQGAVHVDGNPPAGALVFYNYVGSDGHNYGHVGISNGDGTYQSTVADNGQGGQINLARPLGSGSLGWVDPTGR